MIYPASLSARSDGLLQGSDHASTKDVTNILSQFHGPGPESIGSTDHDGNSSVGLRTTVPSDIEEAAAEQDEGEGVREEVGHKQGREGVDGVPQLRTQRSEESLLSQFPPTQEMPRAAMQSPIPLPPTGSSDRAVPEGDDAMRMSPPASAN